MPEMRSGAAPIVVGLDGSEASMAALRWAAEEAAAHGAPLIAVHVIDPRAHRFAPYAGRAPHAMRDPVHDSVRDADIAVMDDAAMVEQMVAECGVSHARRVIEVGVPSQVLVRQAIGARMLVLGQADHHRLRAGAGPYQPPVLGVISRACVARATCPVVVVPIPAQRHASSVLRPEPHSVPEVRVPAHRGASAEHTPVEGGRELYPHRPVPIAHG
ncbi:MAG TPA: universal stress protein [Actinocrinis sp.]|jgi:nucleotide-binding universal stress UspA family protein|uniref:universal stress protein n=1 Tax=Actinocrinis sp. TaxID=1920516 RepID=UPI002D2A73B3|nr:universal stress protein [Actinocrinis sp.]HZU56846.1 universal stress protein [Actinocrinis sp.]